MFGYKSVLDCWGRLMGDKLVVNEYFTGCHVQERQTCSSQKLWAEHKEHKEIQTNIRRKFLKLSIINQQNNIFKTVVNSLLLEISKRA